MDTISPVLVGYEVDTVSAHLFWYGVRTAMGWTRVDPGVPGPDGAPLTLKLLDTGLEGDGLLLPADVQTQDSDQHTQGVDQHTHRV